MNLSRIGYYCLFLGTFVSCTMIMNNNIKITPEYPGVDPKVALYVDEWLSLAKERGLLFDNVVTVGFKDINRGDVIGMCNYGMGFREVDLDNKFWRESTEISKRALVDHELTHCYCYRGHDFGNGQEYEDAERDIKDPSKKDGFFIDRCPTSLMFPYIVEDRCFLAHYPDYINEVFNRCKRY